MTRFSGMIVAAALIGSVAVPAAAATTTYTSKATFDAAVSSTTVDFNAFTTVTPFATTPVDAGPFTIALVGASNNAPQNYVGPLIAVNGFTVNGTPDVSVRTTNGGSIVLSFDSAINAFAAQFNDINNTVTNKTGLRFGSETFFPLQGFFGFVSDSAFSTLTFTTVLGQDDGYAFDNVQFALAPAPIAGAAPEPGTWAMMIVGFGAAGGALRRRRKVTARVAYA